MRRSLLVLALSLVPLAAQAQSPGPDYTHCNTTPVALSTGTAANLDSLILAPGNYWNVTGVVFRIDSTAKRTLMLGGADTVTAAVTVATRFYREQSTGHANGVDSAATDTVSRTIPMWRAYFPTTPGKIYLVGSSTFTIGGVKMYGCLNATIAH